MCFHLDFSFSFLFLFLFFFPFHQNIKILEVVLACLHPQVSNGLVADRLLPTPCFTLFLLHRQTRNTTLHARLQWELTSCHNPNFLTGARAEATALSLSLFVLCDSRRPTPLCVSQHKSLIKSHLQSRQNNEHPIIALPRPWLRANPSRRAPTRAQSCPSAP